MRGWSAVCPAGAILPDDAEKVQEIEIGSIILAPGADVFNPQVLDTYGYGVNPNVVTSLEYERILSASGPTKGELVRPSDGKRPRRSPGFSASGPGGFRWARSRIARAPAACSPSRKRSSPGSASMTIWRRPCSTWTCARREKITSSTSSGPLTITASAWCAARPHTVEPIIEAGTPSGDLQIRYPSEGDGSFQTEVFDLVVLATGFRVSPEAQGAGRKDRHRP